MEIKPPSDNTAAQRNPSLEQAIDFSQSVDPAQVDLLPEKISQLRARFNTQIESGLHPGAQLVVLRHGQVVVDLFGGVTHRPGSPPVQPGTVFLTFSVAKPFTGMCAHHLVERGLLALDAPVADYWPEFAAGGKQAATIRHVLSHRAGIPSRGLVKQVPLWRDWTRVSANVAGLEAEFPPGEKSIYHTVNYGFILGELVRRVSGMPVDEYLRRYFLEPLGMDDTDLKESDSLRGRTTGLYLGHAQQFLAWLAFSLPRIRCALVPAATLFSSARDLAVFYQMLLNGGFYGGRRYLQPDTIRQATGLNFDGWDPVQRRPMRRALGFQLGGLARGEVGEPTFFGKDSSLDTFGHAGQGTCIAWADRHSALVFAFTCNRMLKSDDAWSRARALANLLWEAEAPPH